MAKRNKGVLDQLRATVTGSRRSRSSNPLAGVTDDLRALVSDLGDRASGGPAKRSRSAQKGVRTRKAAARARSERSKKAARTRAKSR